MLGWRRTCTDGAKPSSFVAPSSEFSSTSPESSDWPSRHSLEFQLSLLVDAIVSDPGTFELEGVGDGYASEGTSAAVSLPLFVGVRSMASFVPSHMAPQALSTTSEIACIVASTSGLMVTSLPCSFVEEVKQ